MLAVVCISLFSSLPKAVKRFRIASLGIIDAVDVAGAKIFVVPCSPTFIFYSCKLPFLGWGIF